MSEARCVTRGCGHPTQTMLCAEHLDTLVTALREIATGGVAKVRVHRVPEPYTPVADQKMREVVEHRPGLYDALEDTVYRLDKLGPSGVHVRGVSDETGIQFHAKASELRDHVRNTIGTWARDVAELHPHLTLPGSIPAAADWMATLAGLLAVHPAAGELYHDIAVLPKRIRDVVDRPAELTFLGICSANYGGEPCPHDVYADRDDDTTHALCRRCGTWHDIANRRRMMLRAMEDQLLTATEMRTVLTRYMPQGVPPIGTIRRWASIGKLTRKPPHPGKPREPRYRVGDVLDLVSKHKENKSA